MECPFCHREIPDTSPNKMPMLACPRCIAAKSYQALLQFERQFVIGLHKGHTRLTLTKPKKAFRWHMALAPHYMQAWCGERVISQWNWKHAAYPEIDPKTIPLCERCVEVFDNLLSDVESSEVA